MPSQVPAASETKALILQRRDQEWLNARIKEHKTKYKGVYPDGLMYWMIASQNRIAVQDIKAGTDSGEGEEVGLATLEDMLNDEDVREQWTQILDGKFEQPKSQAKYCIPRAAVVNIIRGETSTGKDKLDIVISDGSGTVKVVAYAKAIDLLTEAKVKVGSVVRLPLLNGQYGYWTRKGGKGVPDEEVLWYKLSLPPFGAVYKIDTPVSSVLKNLDQVVVRPKDACFVDGIITNLDPSQKDVCSKCFRWYDEKKADEHRKCKGAEILETTSYEGTITTTSGQIYRLVWVANARNGELTVREPKIKIADDNVRIFGTLTERNAVVVTGFKIIDPTEIHAGKDSTDEDVEVPAKAEDGPKRLPKVAAKPEPEEDDEDEDEEKEAPVRRKPNLIRALASSVDDDDETDTEGDEEDEAQTPPPRRRVATPPAAQEAEEEDEDDEDGEAPAPPPRRRVVAKALPEPQDESEDDEEQEDDEDEDEAPAAPVLRRRAIPADAIADRRKFAAKVEVVEADDDAEDEEQEEPIVKAVVSKKARNGTASKVTEFIQTALTNFGTPQRIVIIAKSAVKAGLVECDDPKDVDSLKKAFAPHLEAAIESGAIRWADDKRQSVWIAKEA